MHSYAQIELFEHLEQLNENLHTPRGGDLFKSIGSILQSRQPEASESIAAELKAEAGNIRLQDEMRMAEYGGHMQHIVMICDLWRMEGMTELACCSQVQMELAAFREDLSES